MPFVPRRVPARTRRLPAAARLSVLAATAAALAGAAGLSAPGVTAASAAAPVCDARPLGAATGWTEFVAGDGHRGAESEGTVAYGGSLDAQWMVVGTRVRPAAPADPTLVVNGTGGSFTIQAGSAFVRDLRGGMNLNGGVGTKRLATSPLDVAAAFPDLRARAARWHALPATGTARVVDSDTTSTPAGGDVLLLTGTDATLNVFRVDASQLQGSRFRATYIDVPAGSTTLIDVVGTGAVTINGQVAYRTTGGRFEQSSDGTTERNAHTVWNAASAGTLTLETGAAFGGTVFAPGARVVVGQSVGHTLGQIVAASFGSDRETHQHLFAGCLPADAPATPGDGGTGGGTGTGTGGGTGEGGGDTGGGTGEGGTGGGTTQPPAPAGAASLQVRKTVSAPVVLPGGAVTFTLTAENRGTAPAADVVLSDLLPVGLQDVTVDGACTLTTMLVRCPVGTLAAGATRSFEVRGVAAPLVAAPDPDDQIHPYEAQTDTSDLVPDETRTLVLTCRPGDLLADGSVRVVDVDHNGPADRSVVHVLNQRVRADGAFEAVVQNRGTGHAQVRLHAACLPARTSSGHALLTGDPVTKTVILDARATPYAVAFDCGTGRTPIAASVDAPPGRARIVASVPDGPTRRVVRVRVDQDATTVTLGVRCLSHLTGPARGSTTELSWRVISAPITVASGASVTPKLECGEQEKGVVAGWDLDAGLLPVGNEPQIKSRVFSVDNPAPTALGGTVYLLCMGERTQNAQGVTDLVNTVTGVSSSPQRDDAVLSASAGVRIQAAAAPQDPPGVQIDPPASPAATAATVTAAAVAAPAVRAAAAAPPAARTAALKGSAVAVVLRCTVACSGTVEVRAAGRLRAGGRTYRPTALLASRRFRVAAGRSGTVRVTLPRRLARDLRAQGVRRVRVTVRDAAGQTTTRTLRLSR